MHEGDLKMILKHTLGVRALFFRDEILDLPFPSFLIEIFPCAQGGVRNPH